MFVNRYSKMEILSGQVFVQIFLQSLFFFLALDNRYLDLRSYFCAQSPGFSKYYGTMQRYSFLLPTGVWIPWVPEPKSFPFI